MVECKHHPKGSIGRPVVQKLHSAVISSGAAMGILVTTGHFTKEALGYARKLSQQGTNIEMIDRPLLMDMAARAGIKLVSGGESLNVWTFSIPPPDATRGALEAYLHTFMVSYPRRPEALLADEHRTIAYRPGYAVTYDLHAVFETQVGVIHRERVEGASLVLDGNTGEPLEPATTDFVRTEPQIPFLGANEEFSGSLPTFQVDATSLRTLAKTTIVRAHTRTVRYRGRNNQVYHKVCEPGDRDILIRDIRQVYLPYLVVNFQLLQTPYRVDALHGPSGRFRSLSEDVRRCGVCHATVEGRTVLCDICGRGAHPYGWRLKRIHGFSCKVCRRTTCRFHGYWVRRLLISKALLCPLCAKAAKRKGKRVREIGPLQR